MMLMMCGETCEIVAREKYEGVYYAGLTILAFQAFGSCRFYGTVLTGMTKWMGVYYTV